MKNKKWIFLIVFLLLVICVFSYFLLFKNKKQESKLISITVNELEMKIQNKDTFILVVSQTGCSHCQQYLPELDTALQELGLNAYVLNLTNVEETESATLNKYINFSGTPTTIFFTDGTETTTLNRIVGYASKAKIIERIRSLGYEN